MHRKLRSWLTVLGIVIGVAAIVALVSIGEGLQANVKNQLGGLGANTITISAGMTRAMGGFEQRMEQRTGGGGGQSTVNLTEADLRVVKSTSGVQYAEGTISGREEVSYLGQKVDLTIDGVDESVWKFIETTDLESGRYLSSGDIYSAVIGYRVATEMFKQEITLNRQISIGGQNFKVVGILKSVGFMGQQDSSIYISITAARKILDDYSGNNHLSSIIAVASDSANVDNVTTAIEDRLMISRHVTSTTTDFTVQSAQSIQESISSITQTMTLFLGGIAGISLLVGGIGIANTMFMSVMERTRLIGVLKALGTTNGEVIKLFLTESAIMGLVGGMMGAFFGYLSSGIISELGIRLMGTTGGGTVTTVVTPQLILFSIGFSVFIGMISGFLPARRASNLQPVEALRYE